MPDPAYMIPLAIPRRVENHSNKRVAQGRYAAAISDCLSVTHPRQKGKISRPSPLDAMAEVSFWYRLALASVTKPEATMDMDEMAIPAI